MTQQANKPDAIKRYDMHINGEQVVPTEHPQGFWCLWSDVAAPVPAATGGEEKDELYWEHGRDVCDEGFSHLTHRDGTFIIDGENHYAQRVMKCYNALSGIPDPAAWVALMHDHDRQLIEINLLTGGLAAGNVVEDVKALIAERDAALAENGRMREAIQNFLVAHDENVGLLHQGVLSPPEVKQAVHDAIAGLRAALAPAVSEDGRENKEQP